MQKDETALLHPAECEVIFLLCQHCGNSQPQMQHNMCNRRTDGERCRAGGKWGKWFNWYFMCCQQWQFHFIGFLRAFNNISRSSSVDGRSVIMAVGLKDGFSYLMWQRHPANRHFICQFYVFKPLKEMACLCRIYRCRPFAKSLRFISSVNSLDIEYLRHALLLVDFTATVLDIFPI